MTVSLADRLSRSDTALFSEIDRNFTIMDIEHGKYYELAATAALIWQFLENPITVADLTARIAEEYAISPAECEADIIGFVDSLLEKGLITRT